ncbi:MAG: hypothetical protein ACO23V_10490 [Chitinophagaceae bacterium]
MLTKEDKAQIINAHIKNLSYSKYNLEVDKVQENAKSSPDSTTISVIDSQIDEIDRQVVALESELETVNALAE